MRRSGHFRARRSGSACGARPSGIPLNLGSFWKAVSAQPSAFSLLIAMDKLACSGNTQAILQNQRLTKNKKAPLAYARDSVPRRDREGALPLDQSCSETARSLRDHRILARIFIPMGERSAAHRCFVPSSRDRSSSGRPQKHAIRNSPEIGFVPQKGGSAANWR
jgi:hypothetical protein